MAEALSIAASVVAILQVTQSVLSVCYDYNAALKGASWEVPRVRDEIEGLRNVLQSLEPLAREAEFADPAAGSRLPTLNSICGPGGVLESCHSEMKRLEKKVRPPGWAAGLGPKRKAAIESLRWPFKETETTKILESVGRYREILGFAISADDTKLTLAIHDLGLETNTTVLGIKNTISDIKEHADTAKIKSQRKAIRKWLSGPDPLTNHKQASLSHQGTTGSWFLKSETFDDLKTQNSLVWLHGKPGSGKTVLSSTAINQLYQDYPSPHDIAIVYFYIDFNDVQKQEPESMIRSLVLQLFDQCTKAFNRLRLLFSSCHDGQRQADVQSLLGVFREIVAELDKTFVVIDALDECTKREELFKIVEQIHGRGSQQVSMLVSSRNLTDIAEALEPLTEPQNRIGINTALVNVDILAYVNERLRCDKGLKRWNKMPQVQEEIREALMKKADGMFRWAVCQLDALRPCTRLPMLRKALNTLPRTLDETYSRILCSIPEEQSEDVVKILRWLTYSARPMRINEVAEIVAVNIEGKPWFSPEERFPEPREVLSICSGLVTTEVVERRNFDGSVCTEENLRLAHFSVQEYLISDRIEPQAAKKYAIQEISAHKTIAATCLAYLLQFDSNDAEIYPIDEEFPLAYYAVDWWSKHTRYVETDKLIRSLALELLVHCEGAFWNWHVRTHRSDAFTDLRNDSLCLAPTSSPLLYAAWAGLTETVRLLLDDGADINAQCVQNGTALHASSVGGNGCLAVLQLLLEKGADVNAKGGYYSTALQAASFKGNKKVVKYLLEKGADINTSGGRYSSALQAASAYGNEKVMQYLLEKGADVNVSGGYFGTALQAASAHKNKNKNKKMVQSLLEKGADVNISGGYFGTALQAASAHNNKNKKIVQYLLEKGADVNAKGGYFGTALQAACAEGNEKVMQYLLEKGADINAKGGYYSTALHAASALENEKAVQYLLEKGADINASGGFYGTALHDASAYGNEKVVQLLLGKGADVDAQSEYGSTALQEASRWCKTKVVQLLLESRADATLQGGKYGNALNAAELCCDEPSRKATVRLIKSALRSQGVAVNSSESSDGSEDEVSNESEDEVSHESEDEVSNVSEDEGSDRAGYEEESSDNSTRQ